MHYHRLVPTALLVLWTAGLLSSNLEADVPLYLGTDLPPAVLELALGEVDRLFDEGGIRWRWRVFSERPAEPVPEAAVMVVVLDKPPVPVITGCRRNRHDHRLGHTHLGARRVTLWTAQVARAVHGDWDLRETPEVDPRELATALGRVLAHELGHLFLRLNGHRENGLMRPSFSHRSLTRRSNRSFRLSQEDLERVRAAIERELTARGWE